MIAGIAIFYVILCYPEAGFFAFLFIVPFLPPGGLVITGVGPCILISVCYFLKLIRGKRTFSFEIFDLFVLMFGASIFFSGTVSVSKMGSIRPALVYLCFTLFYFTAVNMIRSKEMIKRSVAILMFSGFLVAVYGLVQNYFGIGNQTWQDMDMFSDITGRVVSTLENPNVLAEYLILIIPFAIVSLFLAKQTKTRMPYMICIICTVLCLVYTWSRGSWLGFIISSAILFIILNKKAIVVYLGALVLVPFAPVVLPETIINRFTSIGNITEASTSYRVSIWIASLNMIKKYLLEGIGVGIESFKLVYPGFALAGIEAAPHSHSLYLQVCVESGIVGFSILILIIFFFVQYCFTAMKKANEKYNKLLIAGGMCAVFGFLLNGFTDFVWYNYRVYLMFWMVVAVTVAICRFSLKNQNQNDDTNIIN
jgi:O-antigen ligase